MNIQNILYSLLLLLFISCNDKTTDHKNELLLKENTTKAIFEDIADQCWNKKNMEKLKRVVVPDFVRTVNDIKIAGNEKEMEAAMNIFFTGFPDLHITLDSMIVKDSRLFTHWTATGTNTGIFGGVPATGKKVKFAGFSIINYDNRGILTREDAYYNELSLLQQLGYTLQPPVLK